MGRCRLCNNFKIYWQLNWKKWSQTCISTSQMNFIVLRVPQSGTKTWCRLEFISRIISCATNKLLSARVKTKPWWWQNNPKISGASVTNFHLTLTWAKENFPVLRDLLGPIEPEISIFFRNRRQYFIIQVLILTQLFFNKSTWRWTIARTKCGHKFAFCQVWNVEIWAWAASVFTV